MSKIAAWLEGWGLGHLAARFVDERIDVDVLIDLGDEDLRQLGVTAIGDRKRLARAISSLVRPRGVGTTDPVTDATQSLAAERRQLTVAFCDLVGSTSLSTMLDPEDLRAIVTDYQDAVVNAARPFDAYVAQYLGDGVLLYFGYPAAQEDQAARGALAALAIVKAVAQLPLTPAGRLQVRIGIATGLVVIGRIGVGTEAEEPAASGETPNLAARLQGLAQPGEIVLAPATHKLLDGSFETQLLGNFDLKGFPERVDAWLLCGERLVATRFDARHISPTSALVGREGELEMLLALRREALTGQGRCVLISGEAGIGKSCLTHMLRDGSGARTVVLQGSPHRSGSPLHPVLRWVEADSGVTSDDTTSIRASKVHQMLLSLDPALDAGAADPLLRFMQTTDAVPEATHATGRDQRLALHRALLALLQTVACRCGLLLLAEDAHWFDASTEELLGQLTEGLRQARALVVITTRPERELTWAAEAGVPRIVLQRLRRSACEAIIATVAGPSGLAPNLVVEVLRRADGVPLFLEELTRSALELVGRAAPTESVIPATLHDALMHRLERSGPAREVAQAASVIGQDFSRRLLAAVLSLPPNELGVALDRLMSAEIIERRDRSSTETFAFRHALIRDAAYESMLRSDRRRRHLQVAQSLEQSAQHERPANPELLAYHFEAAGQWHQALTYRRSAGEQAASNSACHEAAEHYQAALNLLAKVALGDASDVELDVRLRLGDALITAEGHASARAADCFVVARELATRSGRDDRYVEACSGLGSTLYAAGRFNDVIGVFTTLRPEQVAQLGPMSRLSRAIRLGIAHLCLGRILEADALLAEARTTYPSVPRDDGRLLGGALPFMPVLAYSARLEALCGRLELAEVRCSEALALANTSNHPPTSAWALQMCAWAACMRGQFDLAAQMAEQTIALACEHGFPARVAHGTFLLGWARVGAGQTDEGHPLLAKGYADWDSSGGHFHCSELAACAADVLLRAGRPADAERFVALGRNVQRATEERYFEAELTRLEGVLAAHNGRNEDARVLVNRALTLARSQHAQLFVTRSLASLEDLALVAPSARSQLIP